MPSNARPQLPRSVVLRRLIVIMTLPLALVWTACEELWACKTHIWLQWRMEIDSAKSAWRTQRVI